MSFKITHEYCWYNRNSMIVKMYLINGMAFTFDELPLEIYSDSEFMDQINSNKSYEPEELFKNSFYLIDEELHPCLFPVDLENPEDMPEDIMDFDEEDLGD